MNQTAELAVGCFGIVHVIELRDVYKTIRSVYKKGGTAIIRPLHFMCEGLFYLQRDLSELRDSEEPRTLRKKLEKPKSLGLCEKFPQKPTNFKTQRKIS